MSINTNEILSKKDTLLSLLKKRFHVYFLFLGAILFLGKAAARSVGREFLSQSQRNIIALAGFIFVLGAGFITPTIPFFIALLYVPFSEQIPGKFGLYIEGLNIYNILFVIILLTITWNKVKRGGVWLKRNRLTPLVIILLSFIFVSFIRACFAYQAEYFHSVKYSFKRWIDSFLLFFIASMVLKDREERRDALVALMLGVFMASFVSVKDIGQVTHFHWSRRVFGVAQQANIMGAFCINYIFLFLGIFACNLRNPVFWLALFPFAVGIKTLLYTFSRGAYFAFIPASFCFVFLRKKSLVLLLLLFYLFIYRNPQILLPGAVIERIQMTKREEGLYGGGEFDASIQGRLRAWRAIFEQIKKRPILGYGYGMVGVFLWHYYQGIKIPDVHNTYLLLWFDNGIFIPLLFLLISFMGFRSSLFVYRNSQDFILKGTALGFCAGITGLLLVNIFGSHMFALNEIAYFWILLAIMADEERQLKEELKSQPQSKP